MKLKETKFLVDRVMRWVKFTFVALLLPIAATIYSLINIADIQFTERKKSFETNALNVLGKLSLANNAEQRICHGLNKIFENSKNLEELKSKIVGFTSNYNLELDWLIWNSLGEVNRSSFDFKKYNADWKRAYENFLAISECRVIHLDEADASNIRKIFGPHFFSKFFTFCYKGVNQKLLRGDSAEIFPLSWIKVCKKFGLVAFIKPEKLLPEIFVKKEVQLAALSRNMSVGVIVGDEIVSQNSDLKRLSDGDLRKIHNSFDRQLDLSGLYICKAFIRKNVTGIVAISNERLMGLDLSTSVKAAMVLFACFIFIVGVLSFRIIVRGKKVSIPLRKQLIALFLMSNFFPLLILGVLGYDYLIQHENFLKNEALSSGLTYLQSIDEMYSAEITRQLKKMNEFFVSFPERLRKRPPTLEDVSEFMKTQSPVPHRVMIIGSHTAEAVFDIGIVKNENELETLRDDVVISEQQKAIAITLDRFGKFYLSRLNGENLPEKIMLQLELLASSFDQIKPVELLQDFFAATGSFWQFGIGSQYYSTYIRVLRLFDESKADYVFLTLYVPETLQDKYLQRVFNSINRNEIGMKIVAIHEGLAFSYPEDALADPGLRAYASRLRFQGYNELEYCAFKGQQYIIVGIKCMNMDKFRLVGLIPAKEIYGMANKKYWLFMASGILSLTISLALGILVSKSFLAPFHELHKGVKALKKHNFAYRLPNLGSDEFGSLAQIFNSTLIDLEELQVASVVQEKLLPDLSTNFFAGNLSFSGLSKSSFKLGGDYYDHFPLENDKGLLVIGDVSGLGVGASMVMAFVKSCILQMKNNDCKPLDIVTRINELLLDTNKYDHKKSMTFQLLHLDGHRSEIIIINAGHCFPLLANIKTGEVNMISMPSLPLGVSTKKRFGVYKLNLSCDEMLVLYTDGIFRNSKLSYDEFVELVRFNIQNDPAKFCRAIIEPLSSEIARENQIDDFSIMAISKR